MKYDAVPTKDIINKTQRALEEKNVIVHVVKNKEEALGTVRGLIPAGAEVMTGSSLTLEQIGFVDVLKSGGHPWKNLKNDIVAEKDPVKQNVLRKKSVLADYFLASVHALTEDGQMVIGSATGSQLPSYAYTSDNVIWVVGAQKIVPTLPEGMKRLREYVFPLVDEHMKSLGAPGSVISEILIIERPPTKGRKLHMVLVKEVLGY
ncbi:MAG: lactate utilization protein [Patescibacteria group bacterium]|nr:lactate utilization protein [Patescibacteria group bacterium]MDD5715304.1 lactate utilization protein [Patescibacteria group bacterium]